MTKLSFTRTGWLNLARVLNATQSGNRCVPGVDAGHEGSSGEDASEDGDEEPGAMACQDDNEVEDGDSGREYDDDRSYEEDDLAQEHRSRAKGPKSHGHFDDEDRGERPRRHGDKRRRPPNGSFRRRGRNWFDGDD